MACLVNRFQGQAQAQRDDRKPKPEVTEPEVNPEEVDALNVGIGTKGRMVLKVKGAKGLPNVDGPLSKVSDPFFICELIGQGKLSPQSKLKSEVVWNNLDPVWNHTIEVTDFEPGSDGFSFYIFDKNVNVADTVMGKAIVRSDLQSGWPEDGGVCFDGLIPLEGTLGGSLGGCCSSSKDASGHLQVEASFYPPPKPPKKEPEIVIVPEKPSLTRYYCGGPLTWQLLYPPCSPTVLHVALTPEDLKPPVSQAWDPPPLREQRAAGISSGSTFSGSHSSPSTTPERSEQTALPKKQGIV